MGLLNARPSSPFRVGTVLLAVGSLSYGSTWMLIFRALKLVSRECKSMNVHECAQTLEGKSLFLPPPHPRYPCSYGCSSPSAMCVGSLALTTSFETAPTSWCVVRAGRKLRVPNSTAHRGAITTATSTAKPTTQQIDTRSLQNQGHRLYTLQSPTPRFRTLYLYPTLLEPPKVVTGFTAVVTWVFASTLMYYAERDNPDEDTRKYYTSVPVAKWMTFLNLTVSLSPRFKRACLQT